MVICSPDAVLFDTIMLTVSLDASNVNCQNPISVIWTANNAISYQLERRINGGEWAVVYTGSGLSFGENGSPGLYEYRVKAIRGSKFIYSNIDGVTIIAQNVQIGTFCVGYDLWESYTSGCGTANRLLQPLSASCGTVWGCTTPGSKNYNPNANHDDGSCIPPTCENCGFPRLSVPVASFTSPASSIFANGAKPASGYSYYEYTVTVAINTAGYDCVNAMTLHWNGLNNPWNGSGWNLLGIPPMGIPPVQSGPRVTCLDYTLLPTSIEFIIAEYRSSSDAGNYLRISDIQLGTCE